ncbi:MAG: hypothetical protein JSR82_11210 [Verrucomicrobia bacterium]|nr:hypothetical protein [Verrucomicrobiota bacterium]
MKITIELDRRLLAEAKALAVRQRTTLQAVIERALRREVIPPPEHLLEASPNLEIGPLGILRLKRKGPSLTVEAYREMAREIEDEDLQRALPLRRGGKAPPPR